MKVSTRRLKRQAGRLGMERIHTMRTKLIWKVKLLISQLSITEITRGMRL